MTERIDVAAMVGEWSGTNRLWLEPGSPPSLSDTTASFAIVARGTFATLQYTWVWEDREQEGLVLIRLAGAPAEPDAVWVDSWHMQDKAMACSRADEDDPEAVVSVRGGYAAPPGPDWGWRIALSAGPGDGFRMLMYNVTPDAQESLAVEATYERRPVESGARS